MLIRRFKISDNRLKMKKKKKPKMNQIEHSVNIILDINYMFVPIVQSLTSIRFKKLFNFYLSVCSIGKTEIKY